jgi:LysR family transcriptional activator of dmlA
MAHLYIYRGLAMHDRGDLLLVLAVKETGSLAGAARRLEVSGAAITKRLAQIEGRLAVRLFRRTTRSVVPTPEGELYCELARQLVEDFESLETRVADLGTTALGSIKIACNVGFGWQWAAPVIDEFSRLYPFVEIELHLRNRLPDLQAEGFDCAIWLWHPLSTQWIIQTLAKNNRAMVASPAYLQRAGTPRTPEDLSGHACLLMLERDMPLNIWRLSRLAPQSDSACAIDVRVSGPLRSNNGEVLRDWAINGAGIALRPFRDVHAHIRSGRLVHVLPDYAKLDSDVQWIAPYRAHLPERVRLLKEFFEVRLRDAPWVR